MMTGGTPILGNLQINIAMENQHVKLLSYSISLTSFNAGCEITLEGKWSAIL